MKKRSYGFLTRSDTNQAVKRQNMGGNFGFRKKRDSSIHVEKTKALISFAVTAKLTCVFVFHMCRELVFSRGGSNMS